MPSLRELEGKCSIKLYAHITIGLKPEKARKRAQHTRAVKPTTWLGHNRALTLSPLPTHQDTHDFGTRVKNNQPHSLSLCRMRHAKCGTCFWNKGRTRVPRSHAQKKYPTSVPKFKSPHASKSNRQRANLLDLARTKGDFVTHRAFDTHD